MSSAIQALMFDKNYYNKRQVQQFLKRNNITPLKAIHTTNKYHRVRLLQPIYDNHHYYRTGHLTTGIDCIYEFFR